MHKNDVFFPKMLSIVLIFLAILFFIPDITMYKIIKIGPFQESLAIFFFPFVYSIADAITEVYGKERALFMLSACYLVSLFFSLILMFCIKLPSPIGWENQEVYNIVFQHDPRIILVGLLSVGTSMYVNIKIMSKLKTKMRGRHFIIRSIISSMVGEVIVTCIAYPLIFLKFGNDIIFLMINAYIFKVIYSIIGAFPARVLVFFLMTVDGIKKEEYNEEFYNEVQICRE